MLAIALLLAACGGEGEGPAAPSPSPTEMPTAGPTATATPVDAIMAQADALRACLERAGAEVEGATVYRKGEESLGTVNEETYVYGSGVVRLDEGTERAFSFYVFASPEEAEAYGERNLTEDLETGAAGLTGNILIEYFLLGQEGEDAEVRETIDACIREASV